MEQDIIYGGARASIVFSRTRPHSSDRQCIVGTLHDFLNGLITPGAVIEICVDLIRAYVLSSSIVCHPD